MGHCVPKFHKQRRQKKIARSEKKVESLERTAGTESKGVVEKLTSWPFGFTASSVSRTDTRECEGRAHPLPSLPLPPSQAKKGTATAERRSVPKFRCADWTFAE